MKKTNVAIACLLLGTTMLGSASAFAAEEQPSTGKVTFTRGGESGTNGLYIESVSNLDFGSKVISLNTENYTTSGNKFEVIDVSGTAAGWNLQVKQGAQFTGTDSSQLTGAKLSLTGIAADGTGLGAAPATAETSIEFNTMDQNYRVVSAAVNEGKGKWGYNHGSNLMVPASALPNATVYNTELTWTLASGPAS